MPVHDFFCPTCGAERLDCFCPLYTLAEPRTVDGYVVKQDYDRPICCGQPMQTYVPTGVAMDAREPGTQVSFERRQPDGSYRTEVIGSLQQMRTIERETEQAARNGEGEAIRFRAYSQDASNQHENSFGPDPATQAVAELEAARKALRRPSRATHTRQTGSGDAALGPGVTEESASVLADR